MHFSLGESFCQHPSISFLLGKNQQMDIGRAITRVSALKGISATKLAEGAGLADGTVSKYKSGKTSPSLEALESIAKALGVHLYELIAEAEGVVLPVAGETTEEHEFRIALKDLEPESRVLVQQLIEKLPREPTQPHSAAADTRPLQLHEPSPTGYVQDEKKP